LRRHGFDVVQAQRPTFARLMSKKAPSSTAPIGVLAHPKNPPGALVPPSVSACAVPEPERAATTSCGAAPASSDDATWRPRIGASHLCLGANGIWHMRLVVPAHIRARHPGLPRELKRSTKATQKGLALARAQKMFIDFFVKYSSGATMLTLDKTHVLIPETNGAPFVSGINSFKTFNPVSPRVRG
jgi:hypothetical protein